MSVKFLLSMSMPDPGGKGSPLSGIAMFWVLAPLAVVGFVAQRRTVKWTLVLPVVTVVVATVVFYGAHRLRSTAEPTIVVCAAAAITHLMSRAQSRRLAAAA